jgi:hypothetical protein
MADDLRERIRRGDLAALADPSLPLHLLAEPEAEWWQFGRRRLSITLLNRVHELVLAHLAQTGDDRCDAVRRSLFSQQLANLDLARHLRALLPSVPAEVDAALAVLERYAGAP